MCPLSVQVCLGLALVTLHHYNRFDYTIKCRDVSEKANLCFCVFADIVYVQNEHEWAQHSTPGHT